MFARREPTTRGVIIHRAPAGEGSARVLIYTEALGLVSALAKSAREERSKLRPHLQAGTFGVFTLVKGKDVWRVTGATETENIYFALQEYPEAREAAARALSAVRQFVHGESADPYLFSVLWGFAASITKDTGNVKAAESLAVLRMLSALGYVPEAPNTKEFLPVAYDTETLMRAEGARRVLVRTINDAIAASGL